MTVCECGIECREVDMDGKIETYCPRCDKVVSTVTEPVITEIALIPKDAVVTPGTSITEATAPCEQCGEPMVDACKARCSNCNWERPCS